MSAINIEKCPLCGSPDLKKVFDVVDHFSSGESFPVCDCRSCGFRFTNNFPSEDLIGKYYDSPDYISHSDSDKGIANKLYHLTRRYMLAEKAKLVSCYAGGEPGRLLDVGCGTGYFLQTAKEKGFTVTGIEKNERARMHAITRFGLDVKDDKSFFDIADGSFNVVTLWHVLEHLEHLNESIKKVRDILTPDGIAVMALPNHQGYDARFYQTSWAAYDVPRHLWHFSANAIEKMLNKHRLKIMDIRPMPLDAFYISLLSEKYRESNTLVRYGRAFMVGTAGYLCSLRNVEQSSSLIYIVKKKLML